MLAGLWLGLGGVWQLRTGREGKCKPVGKINTKKKQNLAESNVWYDDESFSCYNLAANNSQVPSTEGPVKVCKCWMEVSIRKIPNLGQLGEDGGEL